jgi:hypothetical protein
MLEAAVSVPKLYPSNIVTNQIHVSAVFLPEPSIASRLFNHMGYKTLYISDLSWNVECCTQMHKFVLYSF